MAEAQDTTQQEAQVFEGMPGADPIEQPENIDMNFLEQPEEETDDGVSNTEAEEDEEEEETDEQDSASDEGEPDVLEEEDEPLAAEAEEETAAEVEEPAPKKPSVTVPKSRLDEEIAKKKALQKRLDELEAQKTPPEDAPEAFDFDKSEIEYQQLVLDGESEKAAALRQQMRVAERQQIAYEMRKEMTDTVTKNAQETALATAAQELEAAYPVFDQNSESFNQELTQEVVELRNAFMAQDYDAVDALNKAVNFVVKTNDLAPISDETPALAQTSKPPQATTDKKRKEVSRKLKAAESQPPEMPGESSASRGEKAVNVDNMTEDEFNALPDATLKRLRGDLM